MGDGGWGRLRVGSCAARGRGRRPTRGACASRTDAGRRCGTAAVHVASRSMMASWRHLAARQRLGRDVEAHLDRAAQPLRLTRGELVDTALLLVQPDPLLLVGGQCGTHSAARVGDQVGRERGARSRPVDFDEELRYIRLQPQLHGSTACSTLVVASIALSMRAVST